MRRVGSRRGCQVRFLGSQDPRVHASAPKAPLHVSDQPASAPLPTCPPSTLELGCPPGRVFSPLTTKPCHFTFQDIQEMWLRVHGNFSLLSLH